MSENAALPLFPLGSVLYPTEHMPLHIFEPRYREMVQDCLASERPFGIVLSQEGKLAEVGCTARIEKVVQEYDDGRIDVIVLGEERFRLGPLSDERAYLQVEPLSMPSGDEPAAFDLVERAITQHMKLLELAGRSPRPVAYQDRPLLSFFIGHNAGLSMEQRQILLEMRTESERIAYLVSHMESFIPRVEEAETLRRKITSNGHFPDFPLDLKA